MRTAYSTYQTGWYPPPQKELGIAYLLWFFFGLLGVHHFYLGKIGRGIGYLLTAAWFTIGLWIDLFTLPAQVRAINAQRRMQAGWTQQTWTHHVPSVAPAAPVVPVSTPAGWYPDPVNPDQLRYWDGARWTHHITGTGGVVGQDPLPGS